MFRRESVLLKDVRAASRAYTVALSRDASWLLVQDFALPEGYNVSVTHVLMGIPSDYPLRPPGVLPHGIFLTPGLRYRGRMHPNIVEGQGPGWGAWSWLCLLRISWNPRRDDLVRCLELVRTVLSNPEGV